MFSVVMDISRNPEDYTPTVHAFDRSRKRDIDWLLVTAAIKEGEIKPATEPHQRAFVHDLYYTDKPIAVVVDPSDNEIVTVEYWNE